MFDIIGFWIAATVFCVPPVLFLGLLFLIIANGQVERESNRRIQIPLYQKVRSTFGDVGGLLGLMACFSLPMLFVGLTYLLERSIDHGWTFLGWLAHCCEFWSTVTGSVGMLVVAVGAVMLLARLYAKFVILSEKVKSL